MADPVVHQTPYDNSAVTPCCNVTPFNLPRGDRLANDFQVVTCRPDPNASVPGLADCPNDCDGGQIACWSPGGPCSPAERATPCDLCGICFNCRPGEHPMDDRELPVIDEIQQALDGTEVTANTWQAAARRLAEENRGLRAAFRDLNNDCAHQCGTVTSPPAPAFEAGVRQAVTWLRADYEYGTGPEWRERGAEWIAERLAEWRREVSRG